MTDISTEAIAPTISSLITHFVIVDNDEGINSSISHLSMFVNSYLVKLYVKTDAKTGNLRI